MSSDKTAIGDRMKEFESIETSRRFDPMLPIYSRIDGRSFSRFTRNMQRPYDVKMSNSMIHATKVLVDKTHATCGYVQSDEISLVWVPSEVGNVWFDRKIMKMTGVLAGLATSSFVEGLRINFDNFYELLSHLPHFDCRVITLPDLDTVATMLAWRMKDAKKNSITMAASSVYSHKQLQNKHGVEKISMLNDVGINYDDYPEFFRQGTWVKKVSVEKTLTTDELLSIPESHRPAADAKFIRSEVQEVSISDWKSIRDLLGT